MSQGCFLLRAVGEDVLHAPHLASGGFAGNLVFPGSWKHQPNPHEVFSLSVSVSESLIIKTLILLDQEPTLLQLDLILT